MAPITPTASRRTRRRWTPPMASRVGTSLPSMSMRASPVVSVIVVNAASSGVRRECALGAGGHRLARLFLEAGGHGLVRTDVRVAVVVEGEHIGRDLPAPGVALAQGPV